MYFLPYLTSVLIKGDFLSDKEKTQSMIENRGSSAQKGCRHKHSRGQSLLEFGNFFVNEKNSSFYGSDFLRPWIRVKKILTWKWSQIILRISFFNIVNTLQLKKTSSSIWQNVLQIIMTEVFPEMNPSQLHSLPNCSQGIWHQWIFLRSFFELSGPLHFTPKSDWATTTIMLCVGAYAHNTHTAQYIFTIIFIKP